MKMLATGAVFANEIWIGNVLPLAPDQKKQAITCAIPATSKVDHVRENMAAASGPLPDAAMRKRMIDYVEAL